MARSRGVGEPYDIHIPALHSPGTGEVDRDGRWFAVWGMTLERVGVGGDPVETMMRNTFRRGREDYCKRSNIAFLRGP